jgi:hypothetical protein
MPWEADVEVSYQGRLLASHASSLSATGLFLDGLTDLPMGALVDLTFRHPDDSSGAGRGQVARITDDGSGVALLWVDPPTEIWMLHHLEQEMGRRDRSPAPPSPRPLPPQAGRNAPRAPVVVPTRVKNREFEAVGWTLDLSETGAFLAVPRLFAAGDSVEVTLWLDRQEPLILTAHIVQSRRASRARRAGVAVRFTPSDQARRQLAAALSDAHHASRTGN